MSSDLSMFRRMMKCLATLGGEGIWEPSDRFASLRMVVTWYRTRLTSLSPPEVLRLQAMAEPADFVHIFDVKVLLRIVDAASVTAKRQSNWENVQEIDIFGEIAGISFRCLQRSVTGAESFV
eukprot:762733-Hanusia_phi.AAC.4